MSKRKANKQAGIKLPKAADFGATKPLLPYNGEVVKDNGFSFSFACFDHSHELFNLGGGKEDKTVGGKWFIEFLDCLKSIGNKTISDLKKSMHELHPVKWEGANVKPPDTEQRDYWQFRISKSKGRVIGILIDNVFYVVWLDPYHNFMDSEGYGGVQKFPPPP